LPARHPALEGPPLAEAAESEGRLNVDRALKNQIRKRAGGGCEYCGLRERYSSTPFQFEHIIAEQHHGPTIASSLALACYACNHLCTGFARNPILLLNLRREVRASAWNRHQGQTQSGD